MIKYLVMVLIGYLVIGVVYAIGKFFVELWKRLTLIGTVNYTKWLEGIDHLDEIDNDKSYIDGEKYGWYIRFMNKVDSICNGTLCWPTMVLTWPTAAPLMIEFLIKLLDTIYNSRFGEEGSSL